jgi:hypothetical protein
MKNIFVIMAVLAILTATSVIASPLFGAQAPLVSVSGSDITITGEVIDAVEGTSISLFCNSNKVGDFPVINGAYTIATTYDSCGSEIATLKLGDAEAIVNIHSYNFIIVPKGGSSNEQPQEEYEFMDYGVIYDTSDAQVPEFSVMTLGLAVIGVGLGLAFLRKQ